MAFGRDINNWLGPYVLISINKKANMNEQICVTKFEAYSARTDRRKNRVKTLRQTLLICRYMANTGSTYYITPYRTGCLYLANTGCLYMAYTGCTYLHAVQVVYMRQVQVVYIWLIQVVHTSMPYRLSI